MQPQQHQPTSSRRRRPRGRLRCTFCVLFGGLFALTACQSAPLTKFDEDIREGMDKAAVLEAIGNPTFSRRWQGKDRWIYQFRDDESMASQTETASAADKTNPDDLTREVHFQDGRVIYAGKKVLPPISAEEQDRLNEESDQKERDRLQAEDLEWSDAVGATSANANVSANDRESSDSASKRTPQPAQKPLIFEEIR